MKRSQLMQKLKQNPSHQYYRIRAGLLWTLDIDLTDPNRGYDNWILARMVDAIFERYAPDSLLELAILLQKKSDEEIAEELGFSQHHMNVCFPLLSRLRQFPTR